MAINSDALRRFAAGPLHGTGLALYFVLLPYVVLSKWAIAGHETHAVIIRALLIGLALFWLTFLVQLVRNIARLREGIGVATSGSVWLAGLLLSILSLVAPGSAHFTSHVAPRGATSTTRVAVSVRPSLGDPMLHSVTTVDRHQFNNQQRSPSLPHPDVPTLLSALPMALTAKRRYDQLRQHQFECPDDEVDDVIELLRSFDPHAIARLRFLIGSERSGELQISDIHLAGETSSDNDALVGCIRVHDDLTTFSFSREGGSLHVDGGWTSAETAEAIVALHHGRLAFVASETELLRSLATRALHNVTVIYLGPASEIDDELRASCVTLAPVSPGASTPTSMRPERPSGEVRRTHVTSGEVRVELLRASPTVDGLVEPFVPTLRRRCVEMVAYLALHRDEPITGDRLRSRVLGYANVEASSRTLANTASAVRRSLGASSRGPRLHSVSSAGLYETHGVTSDVEIFHTLVIRSRSLASPDAAQLAHQALQLVRGEPLASALRGFEWFLAEGHLAQLQRDGEYAALVLHHQATSDGDFELAFWALQQGLFIDPYSDALIEAIARVPRLRQFGRNGSGGAQHETVGASGTVAVGWSFNRLGN